MIIDFHTHIFPPDIIRNKPDYFNDPVFSLLYSNEKSKIIDHTGLIRAMDDSHIDHAVAMGFPWEEPEYCDKHNNYLAEAMADSGNRIIAFGNVPLKDKNAIEDRVKSIKESGMAGIGEIAFYSAGLAGPDSKNSSVLERIFDSALRHSLPVCLHVNEPVGHYYSGKHLTDLTTIYSILENFPELTVILAHWGGGLFFYELMKEVRASLKNVYYDTAASPYLYNDSVYGTAVNITGSEKILFGSDFPLVSFNRYIQAIDKNLNDETARDNILGANAEKILRSFRFIDSAAI